MNQENDMFRGSIMKAVNKLRNGGPGFKLAISCLVGVVGSSLYFGRKLDNELYR